MRNKTWYYSVHMLESTIMKQKGFCLVQRIFCSIFHQKQHTDTVCGKTQPLAQIRKAMYQPRQNIAIQDTWQ